MRVEAGQLRRWSGGGIFLVVKTNPTDEYGNVFVDLLEEGELWRTDDKWIEMYSEVIDESVP